jgi:hypothetical protein
MYHKVKTAFKAIPKNCRVNVYTIQLKEDITYWRKILKRVVATANARTFTVARFMTVQISVFQGSF